MRSANVVSIETARFKGERTTPDGLSFCPAKRERQYLKLTKEDKQELHRLMTGRAKEGDDD